MNKCFIFGALDIEKLPIMPDKDDFVIAADKGLLNVKKFGIVPDIVVGDFDSLGKVPELENVVTLPIHKDDTDLGYSIKIAKDKGFDEFYIFGALGGRLDMSFANFSLISALARDKIKVVLFGQNERACSVSNGRISFENGKGRISVFAFGEEATGVYLDGLLYPLNNANLSPYFPLGVSNSFLENDASISVKNGTLLIIWQDDILPKFE